MQEKTTVTNDSVEQGIIQLETNKKPVNKKLIILAVGIVAIGVTAGVIAYFNSPVQRAQRLLDTGARYLNDLDYTQAYAQFAKALEIAPNDPVITEAVETYLDESITATEPLMEKEEYETVMVQMEEMLNYKETFSVETIDRAQQTYDTAENEVIIISEVNEGNAAFDSGNYEEASTHYEEAIKRGSSDEDVVANNTRSHTYQELINLCASGDWEAIAALMDSEDFDPLVEEIGDAPIYIEEGKNLIVGKSDGVLYVMTGDITDVNAEGTATAIFSGDNTYSVYEGAWKDRKPNGEGELSIWDKRDLRLSDHL